MAICERCGTDFNPTTPGTWHKITGWVEQRASQGLSANAVHQKTFTGAKLCPDCGQERRLGIIHGQESLFGR